MHAVIHLKENDDQRTVVTVRKRNSCRLSSDLDSDDDIQDISRDTSYNDISTCSSDLEDPFSNEITDKTDTGIESDADTTETSLGLNCEIPKSLTLPPKLIIKKMEWDELDELLQVERVVDETSKLYQTMSGALPTQSSLESNSTQSGSDSTKDDTSL